jgi:mitogen-activated protein kinase 1/3
MLHEYIEGTDHTHFMYPSGIDKFKQQFACLEEGYTETGSALERKYTSLPRERVCTSLDEDDDEYFDNTGKRHGASVTRATIQSPPRFHKIEDVNSSCRNASVMKNGYNKFKCSPRNLMKNDTITASKCIGVTGRECKVQSE